MATKLDEAVDKYLRLHEFLHETDGRDVLEHFALEHPATRESVRAYVQGYAFDASKVHVLNERIREIHTSPLFDEHVRHLPVPEKGRAPRVPRLRVLLTETDDDPSLSRFLADLLDTLLRTGPGDRAELFERKLQGHTELDELFLVTHLQGLCQDLSSPAILCLFELATRARTNDAVRLMLLREYCSYLQQNRWFARALEVCELFMEAAEEVEPNPEGLDKVRDVYWYALFREQRRQEAEAIIEDWSRRNPHLKRPLVNLAIVAGDRDERAKRLRVSGAETGDSTHQGNVLFVEHCLEAGDNFAAERTLAMACPKAGPKTPGIYWLCRHNVECATRGNTEVLGHFLQHQGTELVWGSQDFDAIEDHTPPMRLPEDDLVSIVMTAYNAERYVEKAIRSILSQSYQNIELFVVDDCSTDGTLERCRALSETDGRLLVEQTPTNCGTYVAKNQAIRKARGTFVALCDSDDAWLVNHIAEHLDLMRSHPELLVSLSKTVWIHDDGRIKLGLRGHYVEDHPCSTFFRREVFDRVGLFDAVRFGADRELLNRIRVHAGNRAIAHIPKILTLGREHSSSLTTSGAGKINAQLFSAPRIEYWRAWNAWHLDCVMAGELPRLSGDPSDRPFEVPEDMRVARG